ncbi:UNVERIFIED_CONTAM: PPOX class F420-dependent enzyme/OxyR family protein [Williamsia faeni]
MTFTDEEVAYLRSQPLARIATVDSDGQPDVVPVGFEYDGTHINIGGFAPDKIRRHHNVQDGHSKIALVARICMSHQKFHGPGTSPVNHSASRFPQIRHAKPCTTERPQALGHSHQNGCSGAGSPHPRHLQRTARSPNSATLSNSATTNDQPNDTPTEKSDQR